jgi:hypothetical protein
MALWVATLYHAGLTVWAILSTAKLPPGYEVPPRWVDIFGLGPTSESFWIYTVVLGINVIWESWIKGQKTFVPPTPFPNYKYIQVALALWAVLWVAGHMGDGNVGKGVTFPVPDRLNDTFKACILLWVIQYLMIKAIKNPKEFKEAFKDDPKPAKAEAASPQTKLALPQPAKNEVVPGKDPMTQKLLDYVRQNGQAKTGGLVGVLGSPRRSVIRTLNKLLAEGRLVREGSGAGAVYRLNENTKDDRFN